MAERVVKVVQVDVDEAEVTYVEVIEVRCPHCNEVLSTEDGTWGRIERVPMSEVEGLQLK